MNKRTYGAGRDSLMQVAAAVVGSVAATQVIEPLTVHDKRYVLAVGDGHDVVRLRDQKTGEIHQFQGSKALYDALGVLADWRERDQASA